ncbi:hypothetical protein HMPREF3204_00525 [Gardnerella pickettii]|nr:hypothetical protein HMPREF3204_00525 [Gardnerella pickettii]
MSLYKRTTKSGNVVRALNRRAQTDRRANTLRSKREGRSSRTFGAKH